MYIPQFVYPFTHPWIFWLFPQFSHREQCYKRTYLQCIIWGKYHRVLLPGSTTAANTLRKEDLAYRVCWIAPYSKPHTRLMPIKEIEIKRHNCWARSTTCPSMNKQMPHVKTEIGEVRDQAERVIIIFILHYIKTLLCRDSRLLYRVCLPILHLLNGFAINTRDNSSLV